MFEETYPDREYTGTTEDNALVRLAIEQDKNKEALQDAFQPSPRALETEEKRVAQAKELQLFTLAQAVVAGTYEDAGPEFVEAYEEYLSRISGAIFEQTFGKDRRTGQDYLDWIGIRPNQFRDEDLRIDWGLYFERKDAAFRKLDPLLQSAMKLVRAPGDDPVLKRVIGDFSTARDFRRDFFEIEKWLPDLVDRELEEQIVEIHALAAEKNRELAFRGLRDASSKGIYIVVGKELGLDPQLVAKAYSLRPGSKGNGTARNPKRDQFLLRHRDDLELFFPDLFRSERLQAALGLLERKPELESVLTGVR